MQQHERRLVVGSQGGNLEQAVAHPLLRRVGLTPRFMELLGQLNGALTARAESKIAQFAIQFAADTNPVVNTQVIYSQAPIVSVKNFPGIDLPELTSETELSITYPRTRLDALYRFSDLLAFIKAVFPGKKAALCAQPNVLSAVPIESFDADLYAVTEEDLIRLKPMRRMRIQGMGARGVSTTMAQPYDTFEVTIEGIKSPVLTFDLPGIYGVEWAAAFCNLKEIYLRGPSRLVENTLSHLITLLGKPDESPLALPHFTEEN